MVFSVNPSQFLDSQWMPWKDFCNVCMLTKVARRNEIIKIRVKINEIENRKAI